MPFADWQRIGRQIAIISDASGWWLGDWLVFGEVRYADRYRRAIAETALDYQTLRNYAWVARKFTLPRRRARLSLQHHAEVAALSHVEQDVWLERAETLGWSKTELRRQLREQRSATVGAKSQDGAVVRLNVTDARQRRWEAAASSVNTGLLEWMTDVLDHAALAAERAAGRPFDTAMDEPPRSAPTGGEVRMTAVLRGTVSPGPNSVPVMSLPVCTR